MFYYQHWFTFIYFTLKCFYNSFVELFLLLLLFSLNFRFTLVFFFFLFRNFSMCKTKRLSILNWGRCVFNLRQRAERVNAECARLGSGLSRGVISVLESFSLLLSPQIVPHSNRERLEKKTLLLTESFTMLHLSNNISRSYMSLCLCDYVYRPASRRSLKSLLTENSLFYADYSSIPLPYPPPIEWMRKVHILC